MSVVLQLATVTKGKPGEKKDALAAELHADISSKVHITLATTYSFNLMPFFLSFISHVNSQLATASANFIDNKPRADTTKKPVYRALKLDSMGREIDEQGNLVVQERVKKEIAINATQRTGAKNAPRSTKENPYLAHFKRPITDPSTADSTAEDDDEMASWREVNDKRVARAKKSLHFVNPGMYIKAAEILRAKEERRSRKGFASGRKGPEVIEEKDAAVLGDDIINSNSTFDIPPLVDEQSPMTTEWWDDDFLPKDKRRGHKPKTMLSLKKDKDTEEVDLFEYLDTKHCKTMQYVQHPPHVKALAGLDNGEGITLPVYFTKKERKRIRKTARQEKEREKREMIMMGLAPAPEPKLKLSNFMKVLGEQAVADPTKLEQTVMKQVLQRQLEHEMRNQAAKLTPAERRAKNIKKFREDTSNEVQIAIFGVRDLADMKHRYKVDVNAQQLNLSGIVLVCKDERITLVVAEGGPKGVKKFTRLMLHRIAWNEKCVDIGEEVSKHADVSDDEDQDGATSWTNQCNVLWRGVLAKRTYNGFKFQEAKTGNGARKVLESKGVAHYWDIVMSKQKEFMSSTL
jgi:U4/U6 small nuclear ribonucleoprotein PRP3